MNPGNNTCADKPSAVSMTSRWHISGTSTLVHAVAMPCAHAHADGIDTPEPLRARADAARIRERSLCYISTAQS